MLNLLKKRQIKTFVERHDTVLSIVMTVAILVVCYYYLSKFEALPG